MGVFVFETDKIVISAKESGKYKAFPTIVKTEREFIVAYREGLIDNTKPHGRNGCVKILKSDNLKDWKEFKTPFCDNELDSIVSKADDELFLTTRSYEYKKRNDVYISRFRSDELPRKRHKITIRDVEFTAFGHIIKTDNGYASAAYGFVNNTASPIILLSNDAYNWKIKGLITPKGHSPILNETSIVKTKDKFFAVMRSMEPSYNLFSSFSYDLNDWSRPIKLNILGHAPMIKQLTDGRLAFVFRDLNDTLPGVGLAISENGKNWDRSILCHYEGNLYNGGYADFIEIERGLLFIVYYTCDKDNEPWIEAKTVKIDE